MLKSLTAVPILLAAALAGSALAQQPATSQQPASKPAASQAQTPATSSGPDALPSLTDKISYAIGMNIGKGVHRDGVEINPEILLRGLKDGMAGGKMLLTDEQAQSAIQELQGQVMQKREAARKQAEETNKKEGDAFLAANKTKPGVVTLPSGLQYKILKEGTGPKPAATDSVVCNYRGTLINGTEFDSSYKSGKPITFPVNGVIKGWTEALQLMPVGSKWELYVPPDLAYGSRGAGEAIGPDETLIFEVELVSIAPKETEQNKQSPPPSKQ